MAKKKAQKIGVYRKAGRSELSLIILPLLLIVGGWALGYYMSLKGEENADTARLTWQMLAVFSGVMLIFPLWAKIKSFFAAKYTITAEHLVEDRGFFSRNSSQIRIRDVRNISVHRTFADRLLGIGDIGFSSAASDGLEVEFLRVRKPLRIQEMVREIQDISRSRELTEEDILRLQGKAPKPEKANENRLVIESPSDEPEENTAPAPASAPAPAAPQQATPAPVPATQAAPPPAQPVDDAATRDELYRLLAEQAAEGKSDE